MMFRTADTDADESHLSTLEQRFDEELVESSLKLLLPVIQESMRLVSLDRLSASQALDIFKALR